MVPAIPKWEVRILSLAIANRADFPSGAGYAANRSDFALGTKKPAN